MSKIRKVVHTKSSHFTVGSARFLMADVVFSLACGSFMWSLRSCSRAYLLLVMVLTVVVVAMVAIVAIVIFIVILVFSLTWLPPWLQTHTVHSSYLIFLSVRVKCLRSTCLTYK